MAFTYADILTYVTTLAGFPSGEVSQDITLRVAYWTDEAVEMYQRLHPNYYYEDITHRRAADTVQPTATIAGTAGSTTATFTYTGSYVDLIGATIVQGANKNIVRMVTNTSTKAVELMLPSVFTDGAVTIYVRSCALTSASRVSPVARFLDYGSFVVDEADCLRPMVKVSRRTFFDNPDLMDPYETYPTMFAEVQGVPVFDIHWPLSAGWRVNFKVQVNPAVYTSGTDEVGVPDSMEKAVGQFVYGKFLLEQGDTSRGLYEMRQGEARLLLNRGS